MQIRDNGKPYRLYFATDAVVQFSLPGDYDATGKTFSLAVRTERNVNTPALCEATGTVSGQIVSFTLDTNTQTFLDAVNSGTSRAWLEIYVGDEAVLLQRPVSIEPRAGSLEGQPPAPIILYYTAAQTDAAISTAVGNHNASPSAHPGTFDAAGAASTAVSTHNAAADAHAALFAGKEAAGTAAAAVSDHNAAPDAHNGGLVPPAGDTGSVLVYGGTAAAWQYGQKAQAITGDFSGVDGMLYTLEMTGNKTVRVDAIGSDSDYDFGLLVTQGATAYALTLLGDMYPVLWPDDNDPPRYASGNTPKAMTTANTAYMVRFHWLASRAVLLANVCLGVEVV